MHLLDRFLRYAACSTQADASATATPSSPGQMLLARLLADELRGLGLEAAVDAHAYVTAVLPARNAPQAPVIGLLAHLDTACEASGANVSPRVIPAYDGTDIPLCPGMTLSVSRFPELAAQRGKTLIVTDGSTLLGADDKAGIAVIMTVLARLAGSPDTPHGPLHIAFTPDEEIGHGAALLDLAAFGADFAYTLDGSGLGTLEYENFNAAVADIHIRGLSIHPGQAKDRMINAVLLGQELLHGLPPAEQPARTEQRQGFYHVTSFQGAVDEAHISLLIRDHDAGRFAERKAFVHTLVADINARYPDADAGPRMCLTITEQYRNMLEAIRPHMHVVDTAVAAMRHCGIEPNIRAIRGGTDGAQLSWRGLPTPNLFVGTHNAHGPYEWIALEDMEASAEVVLRIITSYAQGVPVPV